MLTIIDDIGLLDGNLNVGNLAVIVITMVMFLITVYLTVML